MGTSTSPIPGRLGPLNTKLNRGPAEVSVEESPTTSSDPGGGISRSKRKI